MSKGAVGELTVGGVEVDEIRDPVRLPAAPLVSVAMACYKHEAWIDAAIAGVLAQQVDFPLEIVVGDDCSPDGSRDRIRDWQRRHPDRIRVLLPRRNLGAKVNCQFVMDQCGGEFIALCEADDCWTDPHKLRQQVDLLLSEPRVSLTCHRVLKGESPSHAETQVFPGFPLPARAGLGDLLKDNWIATCSVVARRAVLQANPEWQRRLPFGDWPINVIAAQMGEIAFIDRVMAFYRVHPGGAWSGRDELRRLDLKLAFYSALEGQISAEHWAVVRRHLSDARIEAAALSALAGDRDRARREFWHGIRAQPLRAATRPHRVARAFVATYGLRRLHEVGRRVARLFRR